MRIQDRAVFIFSLAVFALFPASLLAHAHLMRSDPASGSVLSIAPKTIRFVFSERVEAHLSRALFIGPAGDTIHISEFRELEDHPGTVEATIPHDMLPGDYVVSWSCVGVDGHAIHGRYSFRLSSPIVPSSSHAPQSANRSAVSEQPLTGATEHVALQDESSSGGIVGAIARTGTFAGMLLLLGAIAFRTMILPRSASGASSGPMAKRLAGYGIAGSLILLAFTALRLFVGGQVVATSSGSNSSAPLQLLTDTRWGSFIEVLLAAAVVALVGFFLARRFDKAWILAGVGGVAAAWALALTGHAATVERFPTLAIVADTLHILAVSSWIGSLFLLLTIGIRSAFAETDANRWTSLSSLVRAFSPVAMISMAVLVLTGLFSGWMQVKTIENLFSSTYGRVLLLKLGLFALTALTGAYNYRVVTRRLGSEAGTLTLQKSARAELTIAAGILIVTGILTGLATL